MYTEVHSHLRESHRKRDQAVAFYVTLLAAFAAFRNVAAGIPAYAAGLTFFGIGLLVLLLQYRLWHIRYNGTIVVLQRLLVESQPIDIPLARRIWEAVNDVRPAYKLVFAWPAIETATLTLTAIAVSVPLGVFLTDSGWGAGPPFDSAYAGMLVNALACLAAANGTLMLIAARAQAFPENDWTFRWLRGLTLVQKYPA